LPRGTQGEIKGREGGPQTTDGVCKKDQLRREKEKQKVEVGPQYSRAGHVRRYFWQTRNGSTGAPGINTIKSDRKRSQKAKRFVKARVKRNRPGGKKPGVREKSAEGEVEKNRQVAIKITL